jgi:hypothetical protein
MADVDVLVRTPKPSHRIIHLRDWHTVSYDLFAADVREQVGRPISEEDIDKLFRKHLLEVELVQLEQAAILRCLVRHHGLKCVLAEGLTARGLENYKEIVAALRDRDSQLAGLRKPRGELNGEAPAIDEIVKEHRRMLLEYGTAVRLEMERQLQVLPLDDCELHEQAKPVSTDGKLEIDAAKLEARHDFQVKAAIASGPCSFIILGGNHDLSESVRRLGCGATEYVRVTTRQYREVSREE